MIDTPLKNFESDLREVLSAFGTENDINIKHLFKESQDRLVNTFVINGQSYAYGNLIPDTSDEIVRKRLVKRYAKLSLYKALSRVLGKELPWGALTGIRPTKLAYSAIEEEGEFEDFFFNTMKVSEKKTQLVKKIIQSQKGIYEINPNNTDFFVFVPFCPTRCRYCSFISQDIRSAKENVEEYVNVLIEEIKESAPLVKKLRSIYIGGGTPVSLSEKNLERILCEIDKINTGVEFTVEAGRPDVITEENLKILKNHGVTRVCVNPQTFNQKTLDLIGRKHTERDILEKYRLAKDLFDVNMDLIAGLDGEDFEDFKYSLDKAVSLSPENITVHTLCLKKGSYLTQSVKRLDGNGIEEMVDYAHDALQANGYSPYYLYRQKYSAGNLENTGYAKVGKACVYNVDVMEETTSVVACGANAISKVVYCGGQKIERYASPKDVATYINKFENIMKGKLNLFNK